MNRESFEYLNIKQTLNEMNTLYDNATITPDGSTTQTMTGEWGLKPRKDHETGKPENSTTQIERMQKSLAPFGTMLGSTEYMIRRQPQRSFKSLFKKGPAPDNPVEQYI